MFSRRWRDERFLPLRKPSIGRRLRCFFGLHSGVIHNGIYRCSWCPYAERVKR